MSQTLIYARSQRVLRAGRVDDLVQLGYYRLDGETSGRATVYAMTFIASQNRQPTNTRVRHPRYFLDAAAGLPGPVQHPAYSSAGSRAGTWEQRGRELHVVVGGVRSAWVKSSGVYVPVTMDRDARTGSFIVGGVKHAEVYGFAIEAASHAWTRPLTRAAFKPSYAGTQHTLISGARAWRRNQEVRFNVGSFTQYAPALLGHKELGRNVVGGRGDVWKFSTILLNAFNNRAWILNHGGYDYSRDRASNEPMHAFWLWGAIEEGAVARMVGIEYFAQINGYPILSVIYYR